MSFLFTNDMTSSLHQNSEIKRVKKWQIGAFIELTIIEIKHKAHTTKIENDSYYKKNITKSTTLII